MQTVPSLVGTGTAVAAAASGLVFGEAVEPDGSFVSASHSHLTQRPETSDATNPFRSSYPAPLSSRPGTSAAVTHSRPEPPRNHTLPHPSVVSRPPLSRYQRPRSSQLASPRAQTVRPSTGRQPESPFAPISETPRPSFSSSHSWVRRLSLRPSSQHDSPRSSVGPDSNSIAFSHGSSAPILSPTDVHAPPPTPNKLVKRASTAGTDNPPATRPRSKSHLPALRRPATSHQRSATLRLQSNAGLDTPTDSSHNSIDQPSPQELLPSPFDKSSGLRPRSGWSSFFHSRSSSTAGRSPGGTTDLSPNKSPGLRRLSLFCNDHRQRAQLIKPGMVTDAPVPRAGGAATPTNLVEGQTRGTRGAREPSTPTETPPGRTRRSLSTTLSTAGNWMSRTSSSIRRAKRPSISTPKSNSRQPSESVETPGPTTEPRPNTPEGLPVAPDMHATPKGPAKSSTPSAQLPPYTRKRNTSSPLPPPSGVSSLNSDLMRAESPGGTFFPTVRQNQPSGSSTSSAAMSQFRTRRHKRSSTLDGSDNDLRDFTSGDEDDTDFRSDTIFDSLRTGVSGPVRNVETPLESMYDESPPSTAGNGKAKRLSIHDMLGRDWEAAGKIMEEDENMQTPVRSSKIDDDDVSPGHIVAEPRPSGESGTTNKDYGRFSIDDDFDEDWTRDDDAPCNALSPPSKGSSLNSRGINPNIRLALAGADEGSLNDMAVSDTRTERPLSNLFDWSESSLHEKQDVHGHSIRPKTAYTNQQSDARGGRSANRRGPAPAHVRSQSVPVVHEGQEEPKPAGSKYGTWGLGTKPISEDWDDDFEFGGDVEQSEKPTETLFSVPESIQAAQPSVKAHSGQIRELSLLVNDLQRLCRHGRELGVIDGAQRSLWKEAEGIIALASPDDDSLEGDHETSSSIDLDAFDIQDRLFDEDYDSTPMEKLDAALEGHEPIMSKTAVIRERPSPRRRSVFSPDDDIFGNSWPLTEENLKSNRPSRPRTPEPRFNKLSDVNGMVRSVVEVMQQRSMSDSLLDGSGATRKMHFDTNSLKVLVKRAGDLRDILSDTIRRAEQITQSPAPTPRLERHPESSPAFTKVFDEPGTSPSRRITPSRTNTAKADPTTPPESSPSSALGRRLQLMTVQ